MPHTSYPSYELQPRNLSAAETSNPYLLIQELFSYGHLPQLREHLTAWFKTTVSSSFNKKLNNHERGDIITMYEWMEKLLEAAHVIHVQRGGWAKSSAGAATPIQTSASAEENIIALITLTVQPESIFRYQPVADNDSVHLLIVLSAKTQTPFKHTETLLQLACCNQQQFTWSVQQSADMQRQLSEGHLFYSTVCTYANRVYHSNAPALPLLPQDNISALQDKATQQLTQTCSRAAAFIQGAQQYKQQQQLPMAAFMLQQAAEQLLRGCIVMLMEQDIKTHAISTLLKYTALCAPQLNTIFQNSGNDALVPLLDKAYLNARYGTYDISSAEVNEIETMINTLHAQTGLYITELIKSFGSAMPAV